MDEAKKRRISGPLGSSNEEMGSDPARELSQHLADGLKRLWHTEMLFDYTLQAEGQSFRVHRAVMASVSDYFYAMMTNGMRESQQNFVELKGIASRMLQLLLQFVYTGELVITEENVVELLNAAAHLQITAAAKACLAFMQEHVSVENCVEMLDTSRLLSSKQDFASLEDFVADHFAELIRNERYLKLSFNSLRGLLARKELLFGPEYELYLAVHAWLNHDPEQRGHYEAELMALIRFPLMTLSQLTKVKKTLEDVCRKLEPCQRHLEEAEAYLSLPVHQRVLRQSPQTQLRIRPSILAIQDEDQRSWYGLQPDKTGKWFSVKAVNVQETRSAECLVVHDFLVICGGVAVSEDSQEDHVTNKCFIFDPREYHWTSLASMLVPRQDFALLEHGGFLYALGGSMLDEISVTEQIERYSFETDQWETFAEMFPAWRPSYCVSACVVNSQIYVCDGSPEDIVEGFTPNDMACLVLAKCSWKYVSVQAEEKCGFPMWSHDGIIYTVENDNSVVTTPSVTWFDPATGRCGNVFCSDVLSKAKIVPLGDKVFFIHGCLMDGKDNYSTDLCREVIIDTKTQVASVNILEAFPDKEATQYCARLRLPWEQCSEIDPT